MARHVQDVYAEDLVHRAPGDASTLAPWEAAFDQLSRAWVAAETGDGGQGSLPQAGALQPIPEEAGSAAGPSSAGALFAVAPCMFPKMTACIVDAPDTSLSWH